MHDDHNAARDDELAAQTNFEAGPPDVEIDRIRADTETAYPTAWRIAVETLAAAGLSGPASGTFGMDRDQAERLVGHVLGAALLELEGPWRHALEETASELRSHRRSLGMVEEELATVRAQRDRAQTAYLHVGEVESEQRRRAEHAERLLEQARNLAVRLEEELALVTTVAEATDRDWLERWADTPHDPDNPYAQQLRAGARIVLGRPDAQETDR